MLTYAAVIPVQAKGLEIEGGGRKKAYRQEQKRKIHRPWHLEPKKEGKKKEEKHRARHLRQ